MSEHLEPEVHLAAPAEADTGVPVSSADFIDEEGSKFPPEIDSLIKRCLDGTEPWDRPAKPWEQDRFSARHVNMAMLRAAGFKIGEIAQSMGATTSMVSWTLQHPYGRKLIHAMMTARGTRVLDIRTKLDQFADEVLEHVFSLTMGSQDLEAVTKVGFGLLDRAGYGATQKVQQVREPGTGTASESTLSRLAEALEQSNTVNVAIMPVYIPKPPPESQSQEIVASAQVQSSAPVSKSPGSADSSGISDGGIRLAKVSGA